MASRPGTGSPLALRSTFHGALAEKVSWYVRKPTWKPQGPVTKSLPCGIEAGHEPTATYVPTRRFGSATCSLGTISDEAKLAAITTCGSVSMCFSTIAEVFWTWSEAFPLHRPWANQSRRTGTTASLASLMCMVRHLDVRMRSMKYSAALCLVLPNVVRSQSE